MQKDAPEAKEYKYTKLISSEKYAVCIEHSKRKRDSEYINDN